MSHRSYTARIGSFALIVAGATPPLLVVPATPARAQTQSGCVAIGQGANSSWQVTNNCGHPVIGSYCFDNDQYFGCGSRMGGTGTLAPGQSVPIGGPTAPNARWRIAYCNRPDFPERCSVGDPSAQTPVPGAAITSGLATPAPAASASRSARGPAPLGLRNMPTASRGRAGAPPSSPAPTRASASNDDVFDECTRLEGPNQRGIQVMWELRNVCRARISLSYCLRADFEAAGDFNLCTRRESRTHSVAPGATVHFAFNLMPPGTHLSDGRTVTHNTLYVRGYACANDSSPRVHFDNGQFVFRGC